MNQRDIAELLGMGTGSAACRQLRILRKRIEQDKELNNKINHLTDILDKHGDLH